MRANANPGRPELTGGNPDLRLRFQRKLRSGLQKLRGKHLAVLFAVGREPSLVLGPPVDTATGRTHHGRGHGWKLVHIGYFNSGGNRTALRGATDHDHRHDPLLYPSAASTAQGGGAIVTITINSSRDGPHGCPAK